MSELLKKLQESGCKDLQGTMSRFLGDEDFYVEIVTQALEDKGFEELGKLLQGGDIKATFDTAHMLKGVIGNCGLTPMYDLIVQIVEPLREGKLDGIAELYNELLEEQLRFKRLFGG